MKKTRIEHGMRKAKLPEYGIWIGIKKRCYNENERVYGYYGGRGITMCDRWLNNFPSFLEDMGYRPSKEHSVERIDGNGNYEPSNCKWATRSEQMINRRTFKNNTSGFRGVSFHKRYSKWRVVINVDGKPKQIGEYKDFEEAKKARIEAEILYWGTAL